MMMERRRSTTRKGACSKGQTSHWSSRRTGAMRGERARVGGGARKEGRKEVSQREKEASFWEATN